MCEYLGVLAGNDESRPHDCTVVNAQTTHVLSTYKYCRKHRAKRHSLITRACNNVVNDMKLYGPSVTYPKCHINNEEEIQVSGVLVIPM